mmetsp:Transcript_20808/g.25016  ORF Transcript_20808/g.25016 Transcript_20808/m.25016 type:complete len:111 (-) Transcript_20808:162-494(-)
MDTTSDVSAHLLHPQAKVVGDSSLLESDELGLQGLKRRLASCAVFYAQVQPLAREGRMHQKEDGMGAGTDEQEQSLAPWRVLKIGNYVIEKNDTTLEFVSKNEAIYFLLL